MADRQLTLGIIGSGWAVKWLHMPALKRLTNEFRIVAVCDINPEAAAEIAHEAGLSTWTTDYQTILSDPAIDAVLLSLPINLTPRFIKEAVAAGKHVLAEKPLALDKGKGRKIVKAMEKAPVVVEIAENFHHREDILLAKEWIKEGRIGEIFSARAWAHMWADTSAGVCATPWRHDSKQSGSVIIDACVHHAAGLREMVGEVASVSGLGRDIHQVMAGVDTITINLLFENGVIGNIFYTASANPAKGSFANFVIFGRKGTIELADGKVTLSSIENGEIEVTIPNFDSGLTPEFRSFYQRIVHGTAPKVPVEEAFRDLEIIDSAIKSEGKTIRLKHK